MHLSLEINYAVSLLATFGATAVLIPPTSRFLAARGYVGTDVNKPNPHKVAESVGVVPALVAGTALVIVFLWLPNPENSLRALPLAVGLTIIVGATIGFLDDSNILSRRTKVIVSALAALPISILAAGPPQVNLGLGQVISFSNWAWVYWWLLVPFGVMACANAFNMAAGYNGVEAGETTIASIMLGTSILLAGGPQTAGLSALVLASSSLALYIYSKYPARAFIGDVGTIAFGAGYGAIAIVSGFHVVGAIAISPMFYELFVNIRHRFGGFSWRRHASMRPSIDASGRIIPPKGAESISLAYRILAARPMKEPQLVRTMLALYVVSGVAAVAWAVVAY